MKTADLRSAYLSFFAARAHQVVPSSSLVPGDDPTLLFTNAGMNQFKDALRGREDLGFKRATSSQRCVRAGGKHNDLENVGYTARHLTFFEMLGNFSFGDYFKEETIVWAWEFMTEVLDLSTDKIWVTVHPTDDDSRRIWENQVGIPHERVISLEENFWAMGETGPCGPCTEIFYDNGPEIEGGPPGSPEEDGDRYVEFWNLVFPQFDRTVDGDLNPLPKSGVDTGMGLERVAAIVQGVHNVYEIDLFRSLIRAAGSMAGINDEQEMLANTSLRVIADHIRSSAFLIADGVLPGNENRSYVLRRIIRRGLRHGHKLDITEAFFHRLVAPLVEEMGAAFPLLRDKEQAITQTLLHEEERFAETLKGGMALLNRTIADMSGSEIPGSLVFQLYDTFGFPDDLTADVARERGLTIDHAGFDEAMAAQRARGRAAAKFDSALNQKIHTDSNVDFTGYEQFSSEATIIGLYDMQGSTVTALGEGEAGVVILDRTPFYGESGGQIGDQGVLLCKEAQFLVMDTQVGGDQHLHIGEVGRGALSIGLSLTAEVDAERRRGIVRNHSATHLMHAALRETLGDHVEQKGSLVAPERLRFDFSHPQPMVAEELSAVTAAVNAQIHRNTLVVADSLSYDDAIKQGAMALFGEKYSSVVRVMSMGNRYSVELCGGTHVARTGDIGLFRIVSHTGIAAGIRRIEAVTGTAALSWVDESEELLDRVGQLVNGGRSELPEKVASMVEENRRLSRELLQLKQKLATSQGSDLADEAILVGDVKLLTAEVEGDGTLLMQTLDTLKSKLGTSVIVLAHLKEGKVALVAGVSNDLLDRVQAPELIKTVGAQVGAKGGGRPDMAQAGGGDQPENLSAALASVPAWLEARLA